MNVCSVFCLSWHISPVRSVLRLGAQERTIRPGRPVLPNKILDLINLCYDQCIIMSSKERFKPKEDEKSNSEALKFYDAPERRRVKNEVKERKFNNRIARGIKDASDTLQRVGREAKSAEKALREIQKSLKHVMNKRNSFLVKVFNKKEYKRLGLEEAKIIAQEKQANSDALAALEKKRRASEEMIRLSKLKAAIQKLKKGEAIQSQKMPADEVLAAVEGGLPELTWKEQRELEKKRKKRDKTPPKIIDLDVDPYLARKRTSISVPANPKETPEDGVGKTEMPVSRELPTTLKEAKQNLDSIIAQYKHAQGPKKEVYKTLSDAFKNYLQALSREAPEEYASQRHAVYEMLNEVQTTHGIVEEEDLFWKIAEAQERAFFKEVVRQERNPEIKKKRKAAYWKTLSTAIALLGLELVAGRYALESMGEPPLAVGHSNEQSGYKATAIPSLGGNGEKLRALPFSDLATERLENTTFHNEEAPEEYIPLLHSEEIGRENEGLGGPVINEQQ